MMNQFVVMKFDGKRTLYRIDARRYDRLNGFYVRIKELT